MHHRRPLAAVVSLALVTPLLLLAPPASAATPAKPYDFNGDGFPELAVGVSGLDVGSVPQAGGVVVLPSSRAGLSLDEQVITQATPGVPDSPEDRGGFGFALASADFDRDGYADLAVGSFSLTILYGSPSGLTGSRSSRVDDAPGALVTGDFDGDGWPELAVGDPSNGGTAGGDQGAPGAVRVFRGGKAGFSVSRSSLLRGQRQQPDADVEFGSTLAVGDLDSDGRADLVVGSDGPGFPDDEGYSGPGSVSACYGGSSGLQTCTRLVHDLRYAGGRSLTVGNVSGGTRPEIVFGVPNPGLNIGSSSSDEKSGSGGVVEILTLSGAGAGTAAKVTELSQDSKGVRGTDEGGDEFGQTVALGDLDSDGFADLVIGAPGEAVGSTDDAGRVTVVYGAAKGYRTSGGKVYDQGTKGIPGKPENRDGFGSAVTLLDHDRDGHLDLDVGAPGEDTGSRYGNDGAVTTLAGSGKSFTTKESRTITLDTFGLTHDGNEEFGAELGQ